MGQHRQRCSNPRAKRDLVRAGATGPLDHRAQGTWKVVELALRDERLAMPIQLAMANECRAGGIPICGGDACGMMARRGVFGLLAAATSVALLAGCNPFGHSYRYKLTVEVDTPQGLKTGYAVREINYKQGIKLPDSSGFSVTQRGEAVAVDLPGGQTLFVLLETDAYVTLQTGFGGDSPEMLDVAKADKRVSVVKPFPPTIGTDPTDPSNRFHGYPRFVRFKDLHDPLTMTTIKPDNLAASFGPGVTLKRITIQMTDEPVTAGISQRLEWLNRLERYQSDQTNPFTSTLSAGIGNFKVGT